MPTVSLLQYAYCRKKSRDGLKANSKTSLAQCFLKPK